MSQQGNRKLTIGKAMHEAISQAMRADESVFIMGEDIRHAGGVWGHTAGLYDAFGGERVRDTPISETAFIGAGVGAATQGMRPIVELMFVDFFGVCMDAIYNLMAKNCYFSNGQQPVPMVLNTAVGGGYGDAGQHSQVLYGTFAHLPGMKVIAPSNAHDAKGLMTAAIADDNPVVFMFHKQLQGVGFLGTVKSSIVPVPKESYTVPIGEAKVVRSGTDITIVGVGATVHTAMDAAETLHSNHGINAEVVDLRSIVPLDRETIIASVQKTGALAVVDDDFRSFGLSGEIISTVTDSAFNALKYPPLRIAYPDIPVPYSPALEHAVLPSAVQVVQQISQTLKGI
jgi:pyruvate dehydrogenase E1 component beta subunit